MKRSISILYILIVAVLVAAPLLELRHGTEFVGESIYGSNWFSALWALMLSLSIYHIASRIKSLDRNTILLHTAFVLILLGAGVTHYFGVQGKIALRKGRPEVDFYDREYKAQRMPFSIRLDDFKVDYYAGGSTPSNYTSSVTIKEGDRVESFDISMNNILKYEGYRFYQSSYDSARRNSVLNVNHDPWGNALTYAGYLMLFHAFAFTLFSRKGRFRRLCVHPLLRGYGVALKMALGLVVAIFAGLMLYISSRDPAATGRNPILNSPWRAIHISTIVVAYLIFTIMALQSIMSLTMIWLNEARWRDTIRRLSLLNKIMLYPSTFLLGAGIFIGAIWANNSWGRYWGWDPKEVWALITFMCFAVLFHRSFLPSQGRAKAIATHIIMIVAFASVLMTYFGVNHLLGGMHSYN